MSFQDDIKKEIKESLSVKDLVLKECVEDINKAIEVLIEDVKKWKERPQPTLRKASERE